MKRLLQSEEIILFASCLLLYEFYFGSWGWFALFILAPDISMLGYLVNNKVGAFSYNLFHHRGLAAIILTVGILLSIEPASFCGFILFAHATMDRMLGYGFKYEQGFKFTHLGVIGKDQDAASPL